MNTFPRLIAEPFTVLFNLLFETGALLDDWLYSNVSPNLTPYHPTPSIPYYYMDHSIAGLAKVLDMPLFREKVFPGVLCIPGSHTPHTEVWGVLDSITFHYAQSKSLSF